jgi:hypothetical protein
MSITLKKSGNSHEVYSGNNYLGNIEEQHLRGYVTNNLGARLAGASATGSARVSLAAAVADRKAVLMHDRRDLSASTAHLMATAQIARENPGLLAAYRADSKPLRG